MKITKRSWKEKLQDVKDFPRIAPIPEKIRHKWGKGNLVIPSPLEVNALMEQIPPGKLTAIGRIREFLARSHGVEMACPLTPTLRQDCCGSRDGIRKRRAHRNHSLVADPSNRWISPP